jgi:hypothetical protein
MDDLANKKIKITSSTIKRSGEINKSIKIKSRKFHSSSCQLDSGINANLSLTHFTPLQNKKHQLNPIMNCFASMDLETIEFNGKQVPVAVSIVIPDVNLIGGVVEKFFIIRNESNTLGVNNINSEQMEALIKNMFTEVFDYLIKNFNIRREKGVLFLLIILVRSMGCLFINTY